jgi:hypothetical protein
MLALSSTLTPEQLKELRDDGRKLFAELNQSAGGRRLTLESDYLQVLARKG